MTLALVCGAVFLFAFLISAAVKYSRPKRASRELYLRECR
jgi:hypothetical protein